jgi:hypothetical protein
MEREKKRMKRIWYRGGKRREKRNKKIIQRIASIETMISILARITIRITIIITIRTAASAVWYQEEGSHDGVDVSAQPCLALHDMSAQLNQQWLYISMYGETNWEDHQIEKQLIERQKK